MTEEGKKDPAPTKTLPRHTWIAYCTECSPPTVIGAGGWKMEGGNHLAADGSTHTAVKVIEIQEENHLIRRPVVQDKRVIGVEHETEDGYLRRMQEKYGNLFDGNP